jgi:hypothetical protein
MATTIERFTVMKPVSSQYLAGTCTSDGDDCDKTIPQSTVVKPVCSKYRAQTCTSNDDDCDEGKHPVELDPQRMSVEPNSVSMEEITTSFRCGRCIDKGIKVCASFHILEIDTDRRSATSSLSMPLARNPARSAASSQARTPILVSC